MGETSLETLLRSLSPALIDGDYVFCTLENSTYGDYAETHPIASFAEDEGLTLVLLKESAQNAGLFYQGVFKCITLGVHSSLQAVGLTAAVSGMLAEHGISANMIAAYHHDHIFVPSDHARKAVGILSAPAN